MANIDLTTPAIRLIGGKLYNTKTANLVAHGYYWDGSKQDRFGRNQILYKTRGGEIFILNESMWDEEVDSVEVVSIDEAQAFYETLLFQAMDYDETFGYEPDDF